MADSILTVENLVVRYRSRGLFAAPPPPVVKGMSFTLQPGRTLGIVGESGSGKSTLLRALLRLVPAESGSITFDGVDFLSLRGADLQRQRHSIGLVAQNPFLSLSPRFSIAECLAEPMQAAGGWSSEAINARSIELLEVCKLPKTHMTRRASELSGGQAQRVSIARALALRPKLVLLDEPTSALDVSVQAQILNLLQDLQRDFGLSYVFVTHNLSAVYHIAQDVIVLRHGEVVERGKIEDVFAKPSHPYTAELVSVLT